MTTEQRDAFTEAFNKLNNREKLALLAQLSEPYIKQGGIKTNVKNLDALFALQDKCIEAKEYAHKKTKADIKPLMDLAGKYTRFTPKKRKRTKIR